MLDGRHAERMNRLWEFPARLLVRGGWSPNAVTLTGMLLVTLACGAYCLHRNALVFGLCLAFSLAFDGLDGAVARLTGRSTRFGGYLDAVTDRYQEILVFAAIAWTCDLWPHAFLVVTGGLLTSYNKARVALEIPISNTDWPDLLERLERMVLTIALLIADEAARRWAGLSPLAGGLLVLGVATHATALQRFLRARRRLLDAGPPADP